MDTVIKNGTIITATETYQADIGIEGGEIALLGQDLDGEEMIDSGGNHRLSGVLFAHLSLGSTGLRKPSQQTSNRHLTSSMQSAVEPASILAARGNHGTSNV